MERYLSYPVKQVRLNLEQTLEQIDKIRTKDKIVIFGAGLYSIPLFYYLKEKSIDVSCFCDNDSAKWGKTYLGQLIISPNELKKDEDYHVLISADCYALEIEKTLCEHGFPREKIISVREQKELSILLPEEESAAPQFSKKQPIHQRDPIVSVYMRIYNAPIFYVKRAIGPLS